MTLIRGASIFDGYGFVGQKDVLIEDGLISRVEPHLEVDTHDVIDVSGMTLLPGLIDCHTHSSAESLVEALIFGVTTEIEMGGDPSFAEAMRSEQDLGGATYRADLISAGETATAPGGHGTQYGPAPTLSRPDEAEAFVTDRIAEGSDFIKIIWEPGDGSWPTLDEATIAAIVEAAHRNSRKVLIHVNAHELSRRAVQLGVDGLAHIFADESPGDDFGSLVATAGVFVIPTLSVRASSCGIASAVDLVSDNDFAPFITPDQARALRRPAGWARGQEYANAERAVALVHAAGARVLAGTDAPNPGTAHGASLHRELELLAKCGMSNQEVLASATSIPAQTFGLNDRGLIQPGMKADLLLVAGDPSDKLSDTRKIEGVWKKGERFDRAGYRVQVEAQWARASVKPPIPAGLGEGLISDFEDGLRSRFGAGWTTTSDASRGGNSSAGIQVVNDGAGNTGNSLEVKGTVAEGYLFAWAGAMFSPGDTPSQPADLSSKKTICFSAQGDGGNYSVGVTATSLGFLPAWKEFVAGDSWERNEVSFEELGIDGSDVSGVMFVCHVRRSFRFRIDEITLR